MYITTSYSMYTQITNVRYKIYVEAEPHRDTYVIVSSRTIISQYVCMYYAKNYMSNIIIVYM